MSQTRVQAEREAYIQKLRDIIQSNFDSFNWHGYDAEREQETEAAQFELRHLGEPRFVPTYTPAQ